LAAGESRSRQLGRELPLQPIQLGLVRALPGAARGGERLCKYGEPLLRPSGFPQRLSQEPKVIIRPPEVEADVLKDIEGVTHVRNSLFGLSLLRKRRAPRERSVCPPQRRKPMLAYQGNGGLRPCLRGPAVPAELIEKGTEGELLSQGKWVRQRLGQGQRFLAPRERLIRIAEHLQGNAGIMQAHDPLVLPILEAQCLLLVAIVGTEALFDLRMGRRGLPQMK
jgi:hypothetical protein